MGNYNSQYASYYRGMVNKGGVSNNSRAMRSGNSSQIKIIPTFNKKYFIRRITRDLIGTFILFAFVIICKVAATPNTIAAYNYSKKVVSTDYDVNGAIAQVKKFNFASVTSFYEENLKGINSATIEDKVTGWLDDLGTKISGKKSWKAVLKEDYAVPATGKILLPYGEINDPVTKVKGFNTGVNIELKEGTEVKASYDGVIKDTGEDEALGLYIVIAHDNNIDTKYGNLSELTVKKGDQIKKSQVIGKSGSTGKVSAAQLHYEIFYVGENINPQDYFSFDIK